MEKKEHEEIIYKYWAINHPDKIIELQKLVDDLKNGKLSSYVHKRALGVINKKLAIIDNLLAIGILK